MKKKIVYIAPHLSTGGMPQYLVKQIESIKDDMDVYCIEWDNVTGGVLVVQRNKMVNLLGDKLITLTEDKLELFKILDSINPDVVHLQEIPELFMQGHIADKLYLQDRRYVLIETSHDSGYDVKNKVYLPDKFLMVSQYQIDLYTSLGIPCDLVEYPIENKIRTKTREQALRDLGLDPNLKHVINVGLFTPRKNQAEIIEYARMLKNYPIQFHFIGNHADNFQFYWGPLMKDFPPNCKWWNERSDVDSFYEAADLFLFTSRGHPTDMETMPLVIRESLGWKVPSLIYNLPVYKGYFDKYDTIEYLMEDTQKNAYRIAEKLLQTNSTPHMNSHEQIFYTLNGEERLASHNYYDTVNQNLHHYGDGAAQYYATFIKKELDVGDVYIAPGDVVVDLGANIGMSSRYAHSKGAAEIHSFEPDPKLGEMIKKNVPTAIIHQNAITDTNQDIELFHWPHNVVEPGPRYTCKALTISDVIKTVGKKIDYLKVDIEGFEETAFDALTQRECAQIGKMMVEFHQPEHLDTFLKKLRIKGFEVVHVERGYQAYIYARYTGQMVMEDDTIYSRFDVNENMVHFTARKDCSNLLVSIKDIDTEVTIWSGVYNRTPVGHGGWLLPTPKHILNYETTTKFGGISVEYYDNDVLVSKADYRLQYISDVRPKLKIKNNVHPIFNNYVEFFVDGIYDKYVKGRKFDTVVDVGANVGVWTSYIEHVADCKKIYLVEPNVDCLVSLRSSFENDVNKTIVPYALSDVDGQLEFFTNPDNTLISSLNDYNALHNSYKIDSIRFKTLIDTYKIEHIDLMKVDIEAGEYALFASMDDSDFARIDNILMEYHTFAGNTYEGDVLPLIERLRTLGYEVDTPVLFDGLGFIFCTRPSSKNDTTPFPKKAYVSFTNEYYLPIAEGLVKSLQNNSQHPIILYSINCDIEFDYPNLIKKRIDMDQVQKPKFLLDGFVTARKDGEWIQVKQPDETLGLVDRNNLDTYLTLSRKSSVILDAIENGVEEGVFIDADGIAKENIDTLFEYTSQCNEYPLFSKALFEYMMLNGTGGVSNETCLERPLMDLLGVPTRSMHYSNTGLIVFSNKNKQFVQEWCDVADHPAILNENLKYAPYHDETIANVLLWKYNVTQQLPVTHYNLIDARRAEEFYTTDKRNYHTDSEWQYIPENINDIKYFHGCKSLPEIEKTLGVIQRHKMKSDQVIIVNAHINSSEKEELLRNSLTKLNEYGLKIILVSNSIIPEHLVRLCDYYVYDKEDLLLPIHKSPMKWFYDDVDRIHLYGRGNGYSIIKNIHTGLSIAKSFGFKKFVTMEYDNVFDSRDFSALDRIFATLDTKKAFFCALDATGFESRIFGGVVDFFLNNVPLPSTYNQWVSTYPYSTNTNTLEYLLPIIFERSRNDIEVFPEGNIGCFPHSAIDMSSTVNEVNMVYNLDNPSAPVLFLLGMGHIYDVIINGQQIESSFIARGSWRKHYLDLTQGEYSIVVRRDGFEKSYVINSNNIEEYKSLATRQSHT